MQQEEECERVRDTERFLQQQKQQFTAAAAAAANQYEQERAVQQPQVRHDVIERRPRSPAEVERRLPAHDAVPSQKAEPVENKIQISLKMKYLIPLILIGLISSSHSLSFMVTVPLSK